MFFKIDPNTSYEQNQSFTTRIRNVPIRFITKPGLTRWNQISPSALLITQYAELAGIKRLLFFGCGNGACAAALAKTSLSTEFILTDINIIALEMTRLTLQTNSISSARISYPNDVIKKDLEKFDCVIIDLPKGRALAQRWLIQSWQVLQPGGFLYLSGSNEEGIQSVLKDAAELFGPFSLLGYKKGNRIARYQKKEPETSLPDWACQLGIQPGSWYELDLSLSGVQLHIRSLPGVFSFDRLDAGTRILLENYTIPNGTRCLDLGCGYGVIGLVAALKGARVVDLVDSNLLAIQACSENIHQLELSNLQAIPSDILQAVTDRHYEVILTNPPFHAGKSVDYQITQAFIRQSWQQLEPSGLLVLVANQFIHYEDQMQRLFRRVSPITRQEGYQVWLAEK